MANADKTKNDSDGTDGSKDDLDVTFNFFYNLVKKMILKRSEVGGKQSIDISNQLSVSSGRMLEYILPPMNIGHIYSYTIIYFLTHLTEIAKIKLDL